MTADIIQKAFRVSTFLLDADGVLTDGSLYYSTDGESLKMFNVRDGSAIKWLQRAGVEVAIITGRNSEPLLSRTGELGIETVIQGAILKLPVFEDYLKRTGSSPESIAYMGDDLHDLPVLARVGLSMAPADAVEEVRQAVDWVSAFPGGHGAVREAAELILKARGEWEELIARYRE